MCGILGEFVESEGDAAKKPKSDKQHFRAGIRNVDRNKGGCHDWFCLGDVLGEPCMVK